MQQGTCHFDSIVTLAISPRTLCHFDSIVTLGISPRTLCDFNSIFTLGISLRTLCNEDISQDDEKQIGDFVSVSFVIMSLKYSTELSYNPKVLN